MARLRGGCQYFGILNVKPVDERLRRLHGDRKPIRISIVASVSSQLAAPASTYQRSSSGMVEPARHQQGVETDRCEVR